MITVKERHEQWEKVRAEFQALKDQVTVIQGAFDDADLSVPERNYYGGSEPHNDLGTLHTKVNSLRMDVYRLETAIHTMSQFLPKSMLDRVSFND